jgi:DNA topoisomerase VI subunit A
LGLGVQDHDWGSCYASAYRFQGLEIDCRLIRMFGVHIDPEWQIGPTRLILADDVQCIIVVEKETIFNHLVRAKLWTRFSCVLISGNGFPDSATRCLVANLSRHKKKVPIVILCDWDPSGFDVYLSYRIGSVSMAYDNARLAANVEFLGLRADHIMHYVVGYALYILCVETSPL